MGAALVLTPTTVLRAFDAQSSFPFQNEDYDDGTLQQTNGED